MALSKVFTADRVVAVFFTLTDRASTIPSNIHTWLLIRYVVTKRYQGQRVASWRQPATQTNRDPNRDRKLCNSTSDDTDQ